MKLSEFAGLGLAFLARVITGAQGHAGVRNWRGKSSVAGAVGLLDRVAPLCFAPPVFFHSVRWYFGI